jgi:hypothetical protein
MGPHSFKTTWPKTPKFDTGYLSPYMSRFWKFGCHRIKRVGVLGVQSACDFQYLLLLLLLWQKYGRNHWTYFQCWLLERRVSALGTPFLGRIALIPTRWAWPPKPPCMDLFWKVASNCEMSTKSDTLTEKFNRFWSSRAQKTSFDARYQPMTIGVHLCSKGAHEWPSKSSKLWVQSTAKFFLPQFSHLRFTLYLYQMMGLDK